MFEFLYFQNACDNSQSSLIEDQLKNFIYNMNIPADFYKLIFATLKPLVDSKSAFFKLFYR